MNKYLQAFGLATAISMAALPNAQAQTGNNHHKTATWEEMTIPDENGYVVVSRDASRAFACTTDKHLVRTFVFALAHQQTVGGKNKPLPVQEYLDGVVNAFKSSARKVHSSQFNASDKVDGIAPAIRRSMNDYTRSFNSSHGTYINWMYRAYYLSPTPHPQCQ